MSRKADFAKLDELYDDNRKVKRGWRRNRATIGLHAQAITYCKRHQTDGLVDMEWLEDMLPKQSEREKVVADLVAVGLFESAGPDFYRVHDFLDWQLSKAERGAKSAQAKAAADKRWGADSNTRAMRPAFDPHSDSDADRIAGRNAEEEEEEETPPTPPRGITPEFREWIDHHQQITGNVPPPSTTKAFRSIVEAFNARTDEGWTLDGLKAATVGAQGDDHRRENGYTTADSVLRPTKVGALASKGKKQAARSTSLDRLGGTA